MSGIYDSGGGLLVELLTLSATGTQLSVDHSWMSIKNVVAINNTVLQQGRGRTPQDLPHQSYACAVHTLHVMCVSHAVTLCRSVFQYLFDHPALRTLWQVRVGVSSPTQVHKTMCGTFQCSWRT